MLPALLSDRFLPDVDSDDELEQGDADVLTEQVVGEIVGGGDRLRRMVRITQKPIGRSPRSNLATYVGMFDLVRKLFAETQDAKAKDFDAGRFSFNLPAGRCPVCEGLGTTSIEMMFMPSVTAPCAACHGARYNKDTLAVKWNDRNIAEILALNVEEAGEVFGGHRGIKRSLDTMMKLGLGYLRLGQPATELSGGESQRIKLTSELQRPQKGGTLYLLDEPSSGLHPADMDLLLTHLDELVTKGNTVVMVEHDIRIAAQADWVIDLGPGAGAQGGTVVAAGTPRDVARSKSSLTAPFLEKHLRRRVALLRKG